MSAAGEGGALLAPNETTALGVFVFEEADITELYSQPHGTVKLNGDEPILGKVDAPITVLEYADFECPHCRHAYCTACDEFLHETLHTCPGCQMPRQSRGTVANGSAG